MREALIKASLGEVLLHSEQGGSHPHSTRSPSMVLAPRLSEHLRV